MSAPLYCDTSALAKWYIAEPRSEDVVALLRQEQAVTISTLTALELRCLLARRRRDALQLALARELSCPRLATADRTMAAAAAALGFDVRCFL